MIKANCNLHIIHNAAKHSLNKLSFDVETLLLKVFNSFSCSAKNVPTLKERFECVQQEYHQVLRHIQIRFLSLFNAAERLVLKWKATEMYFLQMGEEYCDKIIWKFMGDHEETTWGVTCTDGSIILKLILKK
jgi:hypothetical protein